MNSNKLFNQEESDYIGLFDLGSNSFHFMLVDQRHGFKSVVDSVSLTVQLAKYLDSNNNLSVEGMERCLQALTEIMDTFVEYQPFQVVVNATHTLRVSQNKEELFKFLSHKFPYPINILSGEEEALGIFRGILLTNPVTDRFVCIDIGGGSSEIICAENMNPEFYFSTPVGCVNITKLFFTDGEISIAMFNQAVEYVRKEFNKNPNLDQVIAQYKNSQIAVGTSGTVKSCVQLVNELSLTEEKLNQSSLDKIINFFLTHNSLEHLASTGYDPSGRGVIIGGIAVLKVIFELLEPDSLIYSSTALREGMMFADVPFKKLKTLRINSIKHFAHIYKVTEQQIEKVNHIFQKLLTQKLPEIAANQEVGRLAENLIVIALAGRYLGKDKFLRHSQYLSKEFNYFGFTQLQAKQMQNIFNLINDKNLTIKYEFEMKLAIVLELAVKLYIHHLSNEFIEGYISLDFNDDYSVINLHSSSKNKSIIYWDRLNNIRKDFRGSRVKLLLV